MKRAATILFIILIAELVLGGGGRLTSFGAVSLRMVLFAAALIMTALYLVKGRTLPKIMLAFLSIFLFSLALALAIGIISGAERQYWVEDVKPLLYVLILPFFYFVYEDIRGMEYVPRLIIPGALAMMGVFFCVLILIHTNLIPFLDFYNLVIESGEFFFRAETTFFYKGFIYLCIALIFISFIEVEFRYIMLGVTGLAIFLTFTRGFIFALALTFLFHAIIERKYIRAVGAIVIVMTFVFFSKPLMYQLSGQLHALKGMGEEVPKDLLLGNREESDAGRIQQVKEVFSETGFSSVIFGHGFGHGVPSRPIHMEISYLEIFHKQGLIGLGVWCYFFYLLFKTYRASSGDDLAKAFFYSACFLFFQSLTNQFINNPIGLSFALLAFTHLYYDGRKMVASDKRKSKKARHQKGDEIPVRTL